MQECDFHTQRWSKGIQPIEPLAFMFELSLNLVNAGSDLYYSLQIGFFHALSLPSNSTNPCALRQLLVVFLFRYRSEAPETAVKSAKILLLTLRALDQMHKADTGFRGVIAWPVRASGHCQQAGHVMELVAQETGSNTNKLRMRCGSGSSSNVESYFHHPAASFVI